VTIHNNVKTTYVPTQWPKRQNERFEVFMAAATYSRWFLAREFFYLEDGGDTFLRNVGSHKIYTAPHPRRRHSYEADDIRRRRYIKLRYLSR
jgi:hypothetical protein